MCVHAKERAEERAGYLQMCWVKNKFYFYIFMGTIYVNQPTNQPSIAGTARYKSQTKNLNLKTCTQRQQKKTKLNQATKKISKATTWITQNR